MATLHVPYGMSINLQLSRDFVDITHSYEQGIDHTLKSLSNSLCDSGRSLSQFSLPEPQNRTAEIVAEQ
jgi:hypothetical protein